MKIVKVRGGLSKVFQCLTENVFFFTNYRHAFDTVHYSTDNGGRGHLTILDVIKKTLGCIPRTCFFSITSVTVF